MRAAITIFMGLAFGLVGLCKAAPTARELVGNQRDSISNRPIYFRIGKAIIDPLFDQNAETLTKLGAILTDTVILSRLDSVLILAHSSPDGNPELNKILAQNRAKAMKSYMEQYYPRIVQNKIILRGEVIPWNLLKSHIEAGVTPYFSPITAILDLGLESQETQARLKTIDDGKAWKVIAKQYLPKMRSGVTCVIYTSRQETNLPPQKYEPAPEIIVIQEVPIIEKIVVDEKTIMQRPLFALKTNLLYNALSAANIEIEIPIGSRWSIAGEYIFPWWLSNRKQLCFQSLSGSIEARYWFGNRSDKRQLTGWFAGLYASMGYYDVEWRDKGYQGEFFIPAALSGGYAHQICQNFSMEYSIGVGYMQTKYRKYRPMDCHTGHTHLVRQSSGKYCWFGPTRLKVSLVWMINTKSRR